MEEENCQMYEYRIGGKVVAYAFGEPWVAQALLMDDWRYNTPEEAKAAWERYLEKEGKNK